MKKANTAFLVLLCLVGMIILGGCSPKTQNFLIENPHKITITSISGEKIEIIDEAIIQQVSNNITSIQFERGKSSKNANGFGPIISWYDSNDDLIESISVMGGNTIMYNDYFWTVVDGSIDIENINELLSSHEVDSVDTPELNEIFNYTQEQLEEKLLGLSEEDMHNSWGEPDGMLSGFWGDIWHLSDESNKQIILYYDKDGTVENIRIIER